MAAPRTGSRSVRPQPPWGRLLWRGLRKKCPNCGGGGVYATWFRMEDRCPRCGLRFEREPGFFVGAYLINFAVSIVLLFVLCMGVVAWKAADSSAGVAVPLGIGLVIALLAPPFFYPFSRTVWSAIDLGMTPLEPHELADAEQARTAAADGAVAVAPAGDHAPTAP